MTIRFAAEGVLPAVGVCVLVAPLVWLGQPAAGLTLALATLMVTVQLPFAGTVMPLKLRAVAPAAKTLLAAPVQVPPAAPAAEICMLVSVSLKAAAVSAAAMACDSVMGRVLELHRSVGL